MNERQRNRKQALGFYRLPPETPIQLDEFEREPVKPLTDEQITDIWADVSAKYEGDIDMHEFARAIEAAHGIKE